MNILRFLSASLLGFFFATSALAQGTQIAVDTSRAAPDEEVEVVSDTLNVNRTTGEAVFTGSVVVTQGPLTLTADEVTVFYTEAVGGTPGGVAEVDAKGNVFFTNGVDTAEGETAVYMPPSQELRMAGDVLLTQGPVVIAGEAMVLDLATGQGQMEGRVRTVLMPDSAQ